MRAPDTPAWEMPRLIGLTLILLGALAIGAATLVPEPELSERVAELPVTCLVCGQLGGTDVVLNLLLFAPFGAGLALFGVPTRRVLLIAGLFSISIETIQFAWLSGRDASLSDVITNTTGAMLAAQTIRWGRGALRPTTRQAFGLSVAGLLIWIGVEAAGAWALQPSLPQTRYWGQWAADLGDLDRFRGRVTGATIGGESLPPHRLADSPDVRLRLLTSGGPLDVTAVTGQPPVRLAPIVSIFDEHQEEILMLGQKGRDVFFLLRTRASDLRVRPLAIRLAGIMPVDSGRPMRLTGSYTGGRYRLRVEVDGKVSERTTRASPNSAWIFFMPITRFAPGRYGFLLAGLWVGGLLLPVGYWAALSRKRPALFWAWGAVGITLTLVPMIFELPPVRSFEWGAAVTGLMVGHLVALWSLRGRNSAGSTGPGDKSVDVSSANG